MSQAQSNGGVGTDLLTGGSGSDRFQFVLADSLLNPTNSTGFRGNTITDFYFGLIFGIGADLVDGPTAVKAAAMASRTVAALATYTDASVANSLTNLLTSTWVANSSARVTFGGGATAQPSWCWGTPTPVNKPARMR